MDEDGPKTPLPDTLADPKATNTTAESSDGVNEINGDTSTVSAASQTLENNSLVLGCSASELNRDSQGGSSELLGGSGTRKIESGSYASVLFRENLTASGQAKEESTNISVSDSAKVINVFWISIVFFVSSFLDLYFEMVVYSFVGSWSNCSGAKETYPCFWCSVW